MDLPCVFIRTLLVACVIASYATESMSQPRSSQPRSAEKADSNSDENTITVTGTLDRHGSVEQQAKHFINNIASVADSGQYARWKDTVCVKVIGIADAYGGLVQSKIYEVAMRVGAISGKNGCQPNVLVTFTDDAKSLIAVIEKKNPNSFRQTSQKELDILRSKEPAVRWWYAILDEGADGHQVNFESAALINNTSIPRPSNGRYLDSYYSSLIGTKIRSNIQGAWIIVDVNRATGYTLKALSSYISLIVLAQIKMTPNLGFSQSIVSLFSKSPGDATSPSDITDWDLAYLSSLYKLAPNEPARHHSAALAGEMAKKLSSH